MFDYYIPKPDIQCPLCGVSQLVWQSKDGPCALLVWEQGRPSPVDQRVEDYCRIPLERLTQFQLPLRFEIYAGCGCPTPLTAVGSTVAGIWNLTELLNSTNAVIYSHESEGEFRKRLDAYAKHPGHAV